MYIKVTDNLKERVQKKNKSDVTFTAVVLSIILAMFVLLTLNTYVFFNVVVDGRSMAPTLQSGDVLVATRHFEVKRGDIIVIDGEKSNGKGGYEWLIKRAIAFGGETVEIKGGRVIINGVPLEEDYLPANCYTPEYEWIKRTLKDGEIFYLGDNRTNSEDSRRSYGTCKESQIVGVVGNWALSIRWLNGFFYDIGKIIRGGN